MTGPVVFEWDEPLPGMPEEVRRFIDDPDEGVTASDVTDHEELEHTPSAEVAVQVDTAAHDALLTLTNPDTVLAVATDARRRVLGTVRDLYERIRSARRPGRLTEAHIAPELVFLAGAADALDALADAIRAGAQEARSIAGDVIADVKLAEQGDTRIGSVSLKVGVPDGSVISAKRTQPSKLDVNANAILDVLVPYKLVSAAANGYEPIAYATAFRDGCAHLMRLASLSWRTSALDHLATQLEQADEHDLAIRLRHAYGRKPHGDPKIELKRETTRGKA